MPTNYCALILWVLIWSSQVQAEPYLPGSDDEVLETLPARLNDPHEKEAAGLREQLSREPARTDLTLRLAEYYLERAQTLREPQYFGYAAALLDPVLAREPQNHQALSLKAALLQNRSSDQAPGGNEIRK